ncbi:conserved hypothetical protein [Rubrivivax sp. A210]|uniref:M90 family metallopeptidase n=1 Tax=Rubrivivax sp. A210 TaxID=2772301 RepID=UPI0019198711|nr:M90 family metallopeptidase [Rubrivivax sp. A210]CAD5370299.1 conserved hypothetical protein [Rubrivivax sp. A210]
MNTVAALAFLGLVLLSVAGWLWGPAWWRARRRARVQRQPFPRAWRRILRRRMPAFALLPPDIQQRIKKIAQILIAEKPFIGCAGVRINDEMRVLVAAQAALLLLGGRGGYYRNLRQVLIYPGAFVVDRIGSDAAGLAQESRRVLAGESWQEGQVILSWDDVLAGAADPGDGRNVVIHEFAHQLDQDHGRANGAPWLGRHGDYGRWSAVLGHEYAQLQQRLARGEGGLIDPYAATDAAEFFAVVSELFFEQPAALAQAHPELHAELAAYYGVDPRLW